MNDAPPRHGRLRRQATLLALLGSAPPFQDAWYRSGDEYAKWARETFVKDKALIERLGLAAK